MTEPTPFRHHLSEQLGRILEETAFMLVENTEASLPPPTAAIEAELSFTGRNNGTCCLVVAESDAQTLAREMLGTEQSISTTSQVCDNAVSELLNILTAWVLDSWWGEDVAHDLGLPNTRRVPMTQTRLWSLPDDDRVVVTTDGGSTFMASITLVD